MLLYCCTNIFSNIKLCIKLLIIMFVSQVVLLEAIQCPIVIIYCCIAILIFVLSQYFFSISFNRVSGFYVSLVFSQSGSCFILSRITCIHWPRIMENDCPRCFSNREFRSQYVHHSFSCYTLASPSRTMGSTC